jgi:hypothetical protein
MVSKYNPKDNEQNRNIERQEGQMETTDTTEDDAEEEDTEEIAEGKAIKSDKPAIQTPIDEEGGAVIDKDDGEAAKTTEEGFDEPTIDVGALTRYLRRAKLTQPISKPWATTPQTGSLRRIMNLKNQYTSLLMILPSSWMRWGPTLHNRLRP